MLRGRHLALVAILACGVPLAPADSRTDADAPSLSALLSAVRKARDRVYPALVNIQPVFDYYAAGKKLAGTATGSGVIIDAEGHVITNHHVAGDARSLIVTLSDKSRLPATLVGSDPMPDIAVIRLDCSERKQKPLPMASLGRSDHLEVGEWVLAMGSPLTLARSLSLGVVSCVDRYLDPLQFDDPDERTGIFNTWIQTDAAINPGNSGGPLVNLAGEVIGINARKHVLADNIGFAIPIDIVREVVTCLVRDGHVERSAIGIECQPLLEGHGRDASTAGTGVLVAAVRAGSPAEAAGLREGDVLVSYDGETISALFDEELPAARKRMADPKVGKAVEVVVRRAGEEKRFRVVTQDLGRFSGQEEDDPMLGLTAKGITDAMARERRLLSTVGVLVTGVQIGGPAHTAEPRLREGDVIVELAGLSVGSLSELRRAEEASRAQLPGGVLLKVRRQRDLLWIVLKADPESRLKKGA